MNRIHSLRSGAHTFSRVLYPHWTNNLKMRVELLVLLFLFPLFVENVSSSVNTHRCYFDRHLKKLVKVGELNAKNCSVTNATDKIGSHRTNGFDTKDGCYVSRDESAYPLFDPKTNTEEFELSIRRGFVEGESTHTSVLNVTISNITFQGLTIRLQNLLASEVYEQRIEFEKNQIPQKLSLFSPVWESHRTRIQFFAERKDDTFFKEYQYTPPFGTDIGNSRRIMRGRIFAYVDSTSREEVHLYVQPLPEHFNVTRYDTNFSCPNHKVQFILTLENLQYTQKFLTRAETQCWFVLIPVDAEGQRHKHTSVADFCIGPGEKLVVWIVCAVAIPIVLFSALYITYIVFRRKAADWLKNRKPSCLLIYSPTRDSHIDVVVMLAEYLKACKINAMVDKLDVPNEPHQNPTYWFDQAFQMANTIVVISSPERDDDIEVTGTIYRYLYEYAMKLIQENRHHGNKSYLTVKLPYCSKANVHLEARALRLLEIPKDLKRLINTIHNFNYTEVCSIPNAQELMKSIRVAEKNILFKEPYCSSKNVEEFAEMILPRDNNEAIDVDPTAESTAILLVADASHSSSTQYATNMKNLNLLGDVK